MILTKENVIAILITLLIALLFAMPAICNAEVPKNLKPLFHALHWRESNFGTLLDGEEGSLGPYQIRKPYWIDAIERHPEIGGEYKDCIGKEYSESIMLSYFERYASGSSDYETLARIHNGGPDGAEEDCTLKYWKDIKNFLDKQ